MQSCRFLIMGTAYSGSFHGMRLFVPAPQLTSRHCCSRKLCTGIMDSTLLSFTIALAFYTRVFLKPGLWPPEKTPSTHAHISMGVLKSKRSMDQHLTKEDRNQWISAPLSIFPADNSEALRLDNSPVPWLFFFPFLFFSLKIMLSDQLPFPETLLKGAHREEQAPS